MDGEGGTVEDWEGHVLDRWLFSGLGSRKTIIVL